MGKVTSIVVALIASIISQGGDGIYFRTIQFALVLVVAVLCNSAYAKNPITKMVDVDVPNRKIVDRQLSPAERAKIYFENFHETRLGKTVFIAMDVLQTIITTDIEGFQTSHEPGSDIGEVFNSDYDVYVIAAPDYFQLKETLQGQPIDYPLMVILEDGSIISASQYGKPELLTFGLELYPGLMFSGNREFELEQFRDELGEPIAQDKLSIVVVSSTAGSAQDWPVSNIENEDRFDTHTGNLEDALAVLSTLKRRLVILLAQVEDNNLIIKKEPDNTSKQVPFANFVELARDRELTLVLLDYDNNISAELNPEEPPVSSPPVSSPAVSSPAVSSLAKSLNAPDYGSFFEQLLNDGAYFVAETSTTANHTISVNLQTVEFNPAPSENTYVLTGASLEGISPSRLAELNNRWIPFISNLYAIIYALGLTMFVLRYKRFKSAWNSRVPSSIGSPGFVQKLLFLIVVPVLVALSLPVIVPVSVLLFFVPFVPWSIPLKLLSYSFIGKSKSQASS